MNRELMEIIDDMRNIVKPFIARQLKEVNFEGKKILIVKNLKQILK